MKATPFSLLFIVFILNFMLGTFVEAHEPIFGIGPHTIHKYGIGLEAELEGHENNRELHSEVLYGITEDLSVTASLPYHLAEKESGLSSLFVRSKWRFFRDDGIGGSNQAAIAFGVRTPGFQTGPDSFGYLFAATIGREARREYFFSGLRYILNTTNKDGFKPGDLFKYDLAAGIRPVPAGYEAPDLVLLLELNGTYTQKPVVPVSTAHASPGSEDIESGNKLGVGPGLIFTYKNIMLKAGIDFIVVQESKRIPLGDEIEFVFALESHLSPFSYIYGK